jgi:hypothetical protein
MASVVRYLCKQTASMVRYVYKQMASAVRYVHEQTASAVRYVFYTPKRHAITENAKGIQAKNI